MSRRPHPQRPNPPTRWRHGLNTTDPIVDGFKKRRRPANPGWPSFLMLQFIQAVMDWASLLSDSLVDFPRDLWHLKWHPRPLAPSGGTYQEVQFLAHSISVP